MYPPLLLLEIRISVLSIICTIEDLFFNNEINVTMPVEISTEICLSKL